SISCIVAGAAKAIRIPASQPKSTIPLVPKTKDNVTPPLSAPSIGTGERLSGGEKGRKPAAPAPPAPVGGSGLRGSKRPGTRASRPARSGYAAQLRTRLRRLRRSGGQHRKPEREASAVAAGGASCT